MGKSKLKISALIISTICAVSLFAACGEKTVEPCEVHSWDAGEVTKEATCGEHGLKTFTCTVCGETKTEIYGAATGLHTYDGNTCTVCGYIDMSETTQEVAIAEYGYYHVDTDNSNTITTSDVIYFGSYPQDEVNDETLLSALNAKISDNGWVSYGYYSSGAKNDELMSYQDVTEGNNSYRAVKVDGYRPYFTDLEATESNSIVAQNGYSAGNVYWFAFSPIEWRVLTYENGNALLNAVSCLDSQSFNNTYEKNGAQYYNAGTEIYSNDWENSYVRSFLNTQFYEWAFSSAEQSIITATTLDNSTSGYSATSNYAVSQNRTTDNMFLLSYQDLLNDNYGFPDSSELTKNVATDLADATVCKEGTAYALAQGARTSEQSSGSWWMLRSAGAKSYAVCGVSKYGRLTNSSTASYPATEITEGITYNTAEGISPAINIKIGK